MGWDAPYRFARLDVVTMIRAVVFAALCVMFGDSAFAGTVPYKFNGMNVTREGGATYLRGTSPSEVAAATVSGSNLVIAGSSSIASRTATFSANTPIAANAASIAVGLLKTTPATFVVGTVAAWALTSGLQYIDGIWKAAVVDPAPVQNTNWYVSATGTACSSYTAGCTIDQAIATWNPQYVVELNGTCTAIAGNTSTSGSFNCPLRYKFSPAHTTWYTTTYRVYYYGTKAAVLRPAVDSDWTSLSGGTLPANVAKDIIGAGGSLPIGQPTFSPGHQDISIGDPYVDPVTGKRYQDKARITPQPTTPDTSDVQTVKQEIDENGNPVEVGGVPVAPEEKTEDPCKLNPERMGCKEFGTPEDSELATEERGVSSVTIQTFAGNATCPPDIQLPKGATFSWAYPCQMATGVRPFLLALAWLAAGLIVIGAVRNS